MPGDVPQPSGGPTYRMPPTFETVADERLHRKQRLAAAFRLFSKAGFDEGVAGHITARDPEFPDTFWVNPFAMHFSLIKVSDLIRVDHAGTVIDGTWPVNPAAFAIHSQVHAARPDAVAAAHTHSTYGRALSALGQTLEPITQDACAFYDDQSLFDDYTGVVLDTEEGKRIAHALEGNKLVVLRNHGLLTVGTSVDSAAWWFLTAERSAQVQLAAKAAGTVVQIDADNAKTTYGVVGSEFLGWLSFQPIYDRIVKEQPDLLN
ncbi:MAG: class II aldolase/adducin family protein [Mycobacteriaceae bacterium]